MNVNGNFAKSLLSKWEMATKNSKQKKKMSERMKNIIILKKLCMYDEKRAESATKN